MTSQTQTAVLLSGTGPPTEVQIPIVPNNLGDLQPSVYKEFLARADPEHLLAADCPFSHLTHNPILVIYDAGGKGKANERAARLTTNAENGLNIDVKGDVLVFFSTPGKSLGIAQWAELDNVIYDELLEYFGQGLRPSQADLRKLVKDFKQGKFRYSQHQGSGADDANKDEGSEDAELQGWG